jgi:hypothetical protein
MRIDELTRALHDARDDELPTDVAAGRDAVTRAVRRHQTRRVTAIAVCVMVLLGTFAVTISRVGKGDPGYGTTTEGIPKLIPTNLPDGLKIKILATQPTNDASAIRLDDVHVSVFARSGTVAPNDDSFVILKARVPQRSFRGTTPPSTATVDPTHIQTDNDGNRLSMRYDEPGSVIMTSSRSLTDAQLADVTRAVRFQPDGAVDRASLPAASAAYEPVVSNSSSFWVGDGLLSSMLNTADYVQIYAAPLGAVPGTSPLGAASNPLGSSDERSIGVFAQRSTPNDFESARWIVPNEEDRSVRGHRAVAGSYAMVMTRSKSGVASSSDPADTLEKTVVGSYHVLLWMENDTTLMQVGSANYSIDELVAVAEGLRTDPSDFRDLAAATTTTTLGENCERTADGGSVCRSVSGRGGSGSCTTIDPPPATSPTDGRRSPTSFVCQGTAVDPAGNPTGTELPGTGSRLDPPATASQTVRPPSTTAPTTRP